MLLSGVLLTACGIERVQPEVPAVAVMPQRTSLIASADRPITVVASQPDPDRSEHQSGPIESVTASQPYNAPKSADTFRDIGSLECLPRT